MSPWKDVWSRSGSKYRARAVILLVVNALLFAGVGAFAFWIRSGTVLAPAMDGYWDQMAETFRFTGDKGVSLGSLLVEPINVETVPMQIPILGLLMATLIGIPILVAILYRFWASLPFIAVVGFLAVMPWLAITLLGSCIIASVPPFRTPFRFMSALLALIPAMFYLVMASLGTAELVAGRIDPIDTIKFTAPWMLAVVAAAVLFGIVLLIARLVDYRTGAVTPLLAMMFGTPMMLFEGYVGRDELHYRLLEALSDAHFEEVNGRMTLADAANRAWHRHPLPRPRWQTVFDREAQKWQMALASDVTPFLVELAENREELIDHCGRFLREFPDSRYASNVLYLKARAMDKRLDVEEFRRSGWIRYYDDFPSIRSRLTWNILAENAVDSELGAAALLRLGQLFAFDGQLDRAIDCWAKVLDRPKPSFQGEARGPRSSDSVVARPEQSLGLSMAKLVLDAGRLHELCIRNRDAGLIDDGLVRPRRSTRESWFGLLGLDPRHRSHRDNVESLAARLSKSRIIDNLALEIAKTEPTLQGYKVKLEALLAAYPDGDAAEEAQFRLAICYKEMGLREQCAALARRLILDRPKSQWAAQARRLVRDTRLSS